MKTIYKTKESKAAVLRLYDEQLTKPGASCRDLYLHTSFGETHLVETGKKIPAADDRSRPPAAAQ